MTDARLLPFVRLLVAAIEPAPCRCQPLSVPCEHALAALDPGIPFGEWAELLASAFPRDHVDAGPPVPAIAADHQTILLVLRERARRRQQLFHRDDQWIRSGASADGSIAGRPRRPERRDQ